MSFEQLKKEYNSIRVGQMVQFEKLLAKFLVEASSKTKDPSLRDDYVKTRISEIINTLRD